MDLTVCNDEEENTKNSRCGLFGFHPQWLQVLASKKSYVLLFGLVGLNQFAINSYFIATITTLEKRFKIPSQTSALIIGGLDIGTIFSSITMAYIGSRGHKTRWVALGTLLTSTACYSQLLPYIIYGAGSDAITIAASSDQNSFSSSSCGPGALYSEDCTDGDMSNNPSMLIFMSQFLIGVGNSMYWTLGISYLDDNVKKNQSPMLMAISSTIRLFGSPVGFWLAAKSLEHYADPSLTPSITNKDPRWIGAWWLGWIIFGITSTLFSTMLFMFPPSLPRTPRVERSIGQHSKGDGLRNFSETLNRLFQNPLLMCNTFSYVFYMFGVSGFWVFMPKYLETQFYMTASEANTYTGEMGLLSAALGLILSGLVMSTLKPSARLLSAWNIAVEILGIGSAIIYAYLGCSNIKFQQVQSADQSSLTLFEECNNKCNCGPTVPFEPVCDREGAITFFSPCHAGCTGANDTLGTKIFTNCNCIANSIAEESFCPIDCQSSLMLFFVIYCIMSFLSSSSHAGLAIIQFRTVRSEDKSVSIALSEMLCSAISYIPSPLLFGYLLDKTCTVWGETCGEPGNCWLYDRRALREYLNFTAAGCLSIALLFDIGVWYYSKNLVLYDQDENVDLKNTCQRRQSIVNSNEVENVIL